MHRLHITAIAVALTAGCIGSPTDPWPEMSVRASESEYVLTERSTPVHFVVQNTSTTSTYRVLIGPGAGACSIAERLGPTGWKESNSSCQPQLGGLTEVGPGMSIEGLLHLWDTGTFRLRVAVGRDLDTLDWLETSDHVVVRRP